MKRIALISLLLAVTPLAMAQSQDQSRSRMQDQTRSQMQDQTRSQMQDQTRSQTQDMRRTRIYGSQLMTPAERASYRERLRSAKTRAERNRIRAEHHKQMQDRARKRGLTLPDMPAQPMHRGMQGQGGNMMQQKQGGGRRGR